MPSEKIDKIEIFKINQIQEDNNIIDKNDSVEENNKDSKIHDKILHIKKER